MFDVMQWRTCERSERDQEHYQVTNHHQRIIIMYFSIILSSYVSLFIDDAEEESSIHLERAERVRMYQEENKHLAALVRFAMSI